MSKSDQIRAVLRESARVKLSFAAADKLKERGEEALEQLEATRAAGGIIRIFSDPESRWSAHHFNEELVVRFKAGSPFGREDRSAINSRQYCEFDYKSVAGLIESDRFDAKMDTLVVFAATSKSIGVEAVVRAARSRSLMVIVVAPEANTALLDLADYAFNLPTAARALIASLQNMLLHSFCERFEPEYSKELHAFPAIVKRSAAVDEAIESDVHLVSAIAEARAVLDQRIKSGGAVYLAGNGGSTCDANTLVSYLREPGILAQSAEIFDLHSADTLLCAYNDNHMPFARQLNANGRKDDIFIAYSTSGNSQNIIDAVLEAEMKDIYTIGLLGKGGGKLAVLCDSSIIVPSDETSRVQEAHALIGFMLFGVFFLPEILQK